MVLDFTKMNGAGNDFILLDNREGDLALTRDQVTTLCDRQRGVGADGLILATKPTSQDVTGAWTFYNSDGSDAEMCGNGARCFAKYLSALTDKTTELSFETTAGVIRAVIEGEIVTVTLTEPGELIVNQPLSHNGESLLVHSINTGVPHAVLFVKDTEKAMVKEEGARVRYHELFAPNGTNVNFVQLLGEPNTIRVRTYERGVEGETLACGTGVTAAALTTFELHKFESPIKVQVKGGAHLEVIFDKTDSGFHNVQLKGPADFVFSGRIAL
jgi:diaminopimelate epimerase